MMLSPKRLICFETFDCFTPKNPPKKKGPLCGGSYFFFPPGKLSCWKMWAVWSLFHNDSRFYHQKSIRLFLSQECLWLFFPPGARRAQCGKCFTSFSRANAWIFVRRLCDTFAYSLQPCECLGPRKFENQPFSCWVRGVFLSFALFWEIQFLFFLGGICDRENLRSRIMCKFNFVEGSLKKS